MEFHGSHKQNNQSEHDFKGKTLWICGVDNISILAFDLVIENDALFVSCGFLEHPSVIPFAGSYISSVNDVVVNLQLFCHVSEPIVIMIRRSSIRAGYTRYYAHDLAKWIQKAGFPDVWIVSSANAALRGDEFLATDASQEFVWPSAVTTTTGTNDNEIPRRDPTLVLPPNSMHLKILSSLQQLAPHTSPLSICTFAYEGDNSLQAKKMATILCRMSGLSGKIVKHETIDVFKDAQK